MRRTRAGGLRRVTGPRRGVALLEALVALVIVATTVTAGVTLAAEATRSVTRVRARDVGMQRASAFLDAVALWTRADLDRHLGNRPEGAWTLRIDRPTPTWYVVTLLPAEPAVPFGAAPDASGGDGVRPLLETSLYRSADPSVSPDRGGHP